MQHNLPQKQPLCVGAQHKSTDAEGMPNRSPSRIAGFLEKKNSRKSEKEEGKEDTRSFTTSSRSHDDKGLERFQTVQQMVF
jgi:hypothetical protein